MRWLSILFGAGLLLVLLYVAGLMLSLTLEARRERKLRLSMSEDELFVSDLKREIRLAWDSELYEQLTEDLADDFFLDARDRVMNGLDGEPAKQRSSIERLARELAVREREGLNRAEVAVQTDLFWFAYGHAIIRAYPECVELYRDETDRYDKPQLSRDLEATSCFRRLLFAKYGVDIAAPILDRIGYAVFLPIRDDFLDGLRLSEQGQGVREALRGLDWQHARARFVFDAAADLKTYVTWAIFRCIVESYRPNLLEQFDSESRAILGSYYSLPDSILTGAKGLTPHDKKLLGLD